jgi:hypothetical protein
VLTLCVAQVGDEKHLRRYAKVDEQEHKEAGRTHKVDSARVYFYQVRT